MTSQSGDKIILKQLDMSKLFKLLKEEHPFLENARLKKVKDISAIEKDLSKFELSGVGKYFFALYEPIQF